jgi:hypothetical protein
VTPRWQGPDGRIARSDQPPGAGYHDIDDQPLPRQAKVTKTLKWAILATLVLLALAVIFVQQRHPAIAIALAVVSGWFSRVATEAYFETHGR